jgi:DNA-directed RNA polymerase specialized sigma24 family protein
MFAAVVDASAWTDEQLIARLIKSQPLAWREFERRYDRLIDRCILKVTRRFSSVVSADDVREIASTLRLSLLANDMHKLRSFDPERGNRFSSWIGLLAINCAYDYLRSVRREPGKAALAEASDLAAETPDPFESVAQRQREAAPRGLQRPRPSLRRALLRRGSRAERHRRADEDQREDGLLEEAQDPGTPRGDAARRLKCWERAATPRFPARVAFERAGRHAQMLWKAP